MRTAAVLTTIVLVRLFLPDVSAQSLLVIEDFEQYEANSLPELWKIPDIRSRSMRPLPPDHGQPNDFVRVVEEDGGKILKAYTQGESAQIALPRGAGLIWDLSSFPRLRWSWRANQLPEGAQESSRRLNDTGAALYVAFDCNDWIGRPCTIKYSYSSTLEIGTKVRYGKLHVLVVSTGLEPYGSWLTIERNVVKDYEMLFGKPPTGDPLYILIWNDSDSTNQVADVYFDDIIVMEEQ